MPPESESLQVSLLQARLVDLTKEITELKERLTKREEHSDKYDTFLDMLIEREASRSKLRNAVIEKSLIALVGTVCATFALLLWEGTKTLAKTHFKGSP